MVGVYADNLHTQCWCIREPIDQRYRRIHINYLETFFVMMSDRILSSDVYCNVGENDVNENKGGYHHLTNYYSLYCIQEDGNLTGVKHEVHQRYDEVIRGEFAKSELY